MNKTSVLLSGGLTSVKAADSSVLNASDSLVNLAAGLGTIRDKMAHSQHVLGSPLDEITQLAMYQSWLPRKVVDIPAEDMTRAWREHQFGEAEAAAYQVLKDYEYRLQVQAKVCEALKLARLTGGSVIVMVTKDVRNDPKILQTPLQVERVRKDDLLALLVYGRWSITGATELVKDITSPNFGLPEFYSLTDTNASLRIHHSRVIRFDGAYLPTRSFQQNNYWHDSVLSAIYDIITQNQTVDAAVSTMMFEANVDVLNVAGLGDKLSVKGGEASVIQRYQASAMIKSFNRMLLLDSEELEKYTKKSNSFTNLAEVMSAFANRVSGAADIPMTRLFGQSPAGMSATGESDLRNYYDMIASKQESVLSPRLDMLDEVLVRSALGAFPEEYDWDFCPLWQMSDVEKASLGKTKAETAQIYYNLGVLSEGVIAASLLSEKSFSGMTEKDVKLAEELAKELPDPQEPADDEQEQEQL